jgi:hypothetical protein
MLEILGTIAALVLVCYAAWVWFAQEGSRLQRVRALVRDVARVMTGV